MNEILYPKGRQVFSGAVATYYDIPNRPDLLIATPTMEIGAFQEKIRSLTTASSIITEDKYPHVISPFVFIDNSKTLSPSALISRVEGKAYNNCTGNERIIASDVVGELLMAYLDFMSKSHKEGFFMADHKLDALIRENAYSMAIVDFPQFGYKLLENNIVELFRPDMSSRDSNLNPNIMFEIEKTGSFIMGGGRRESGVFISFVHELLRQSGGGYSAQRYLLDIKSAKTAQEAIEKIKITINELRETRLSVGIMPVLQGMCENVTSNTQLQSVKLQNAASTGDVLSAEHQIKFGTKLL